MIYIDFHVHPEVSRGTGFSLSHLNDTLKQAVKNGIDAFVMVNHFDTRDFRQVFEILNDEFSYEKPFYIANGIAIIPGMEIVTREGPHILIAGSRGEILRVHKELKETIKTSSEPSIEQCFELFRKADVITVCAHPLSNGSEITRLDKDLRARFDAIELNGNQLAKQGTKLRNRVKRLSRQLKLPVVAGSDSHVHHQIGSIATCFPRAFSTITELRELLRDKKKKHRLHPELNKMVRRAHRVRAKLT